MAESQRGAGVVHLDIEPGDVGETLVVLTCPTCGLEKSAESRQVVTLGCAVLDMALHLQACLPPRTLEKGNAPSPGVDTGSSDA